MARNSRALAFQPQRSSSPTQDEIDRLRHAFADRMALLIGNGPEEKNLENFSRKTGIAIRQISQWKNHRHLNWPNVKNLIAISRGAGISIDWLLLGDETHEAKRRTAG